MSAEAAGPYFAEAIGLARALGDRWRLSQLLTAQAGAAIFAGVRGPAEEGRDLAEAIGDRFGSRRCRFGLGWAQLFQGDLAGAAAQFAELVAGAGAAHDAAFGLASQGIVLAYQGETGAALGAEHA